MNEWEERVASRGTRSSLQLHTQDPLFYNLVSVQEVTQSSGGPAGESNGSMRLIVGGGGGQAPGGRTRAVVGSRSRRSSKLGSSS